MMNLNLYLNGMTENYYGLVTVANKKRSRLMFPCW